MLPGAPGQKPALDTSCEYASRVIASAPSRAGALRPLKRVTARSKPPQKKCTGLDFPRNRERNSFKTAADDEATRHQRLAYSRSYDACCSSRSNRIGEATSHGIGQMGTSTPSRASVAISFR